MKYFATTYVKVELSGTVESDAESTVSHDNKETSHLDGESSVGLGERNCFSVQEYLEISVY